MIFERIIWFIEGVEWPSITGYLSLHHALLWVVFIALNFGALYMARGRLRRVYWKKWYDPSPKGPNGEVDWETVRMLMKTDPLPETNENRSVHEIIREFICIVLKNLRLPPMYLLIDVPCAVLFLCGDVLAACWIYEQGALVTSGQAKDAAVAFGGFGVVATLFGAVHQARVKARSENRQAWINELRDQMNELIAKMPQPINTPQQYRKAENEYTKIHTRLELFLNPSERVHRAFMTLVRHMYGVYDLAIDQQVRRELQLDEYKPPMVGKDWVKMKSCTIRLANILLKREWEQVKLIA